MVEELTRMAAIEEINASKQAEFDKKADVFELDDDFDCSPEYLGQREAERRIRRLEFPDDRRKEFDELLGALPESVAVVGGAARSIARSAVTGDYEQVRDIDLVEIVMPDSESALDDDVRWELSHRFMPDDAEQGHAMGQRTLEDCFLECDTTLNQCAVINGELYVSEAAIHDFESGVIRPSTHEKSSTDQKVRGRVAIRMIMLKVISEQASGEEYEILDCEPGGRYGFEMAVALNKAMSRGRDMAEAFTRELAAQDLIDERFSGDPVGLAKYLFESGEIINFEFRDTIGDTVKRPVSAKERARRAMNAYYTSSAELRDVMSEYDGDANEDYYTDEEYAEINSCCGWIDPSYDDIYEEDDSDYEYGYDPDYDSDYESDDEFDEEYSDDSDDEYFDEDAIELSEA